MAMRDFKFQVQDAKGNKMPFASYKGKNKVELEMKILGFIDEFVMKDTLVEAKEVLDKIGKL